MQKIKKFYREANYVHLALMGDFNGNLLNEVNNKLKNTLSNYSKVICSPTTRKNTLIDHIYIKGQEYVPTQSGIVPTYYSFHEMTFVSINTGSGI